MKVQDTPQVSRPPGPLPRPCLYRVAGKLETGCPRARLPGFCAYPQPQADTIPLLYEKGCQETVDTLTSPQGFAVVEKDAPGDTGSKSGSKAVTPL